MDFTVRKYKELLNSMKDAGYEFQTYTEFINAPKRKVIVLRHDVDLKPENSLVFAEIQATIGVKSVYYFRAVKESWNEDIIKRISLLGHEIGYHYENITTTKGNLTLAFEDFKKNLELLRTIAPVTTICMHGSPMSKFDSKDLWKTFDYKSLGIIAEPYFDTNFNKVFYLTDTGGTWNSEKFSVRDKVNTTFTQKFANTNQIIDAFVQKKLPGQIMFTFHPQRWNDNIIKWLIELISQNAKNLIKRLLIKIRK